MSELPPYLELRPSPGKGLGVFARQAIPSGMFLGHYVGVRVSNETDGDYVLSAEGYDQDGRYVSEFSIDAADKSRSNWTRYLNSVNADEVKNCDWYIDIGRTIGIKTIRPISAGEELLLDYGNEFF